MLILFDGVNEIAEDFQPAAFVAINAFIRTYCNPENSSYNNFFVSCREADYAKQFSHLPRLVLQPLDNERITLFLTTHFPNDNAAVTDIERRLDANQGQLRQLVGNPYLLKVVVDVYRETGELPNTRGALLREFSHSLMARGLQNDPDTANKKLLQELLPSKKDIFKFSLAKLDTATRKIAIKNLADLVEPLMRQLAFAMLMDKTQGTVTDLKFVQAHLPTIATSIIEYRLPNSFKLGQQTVEQDSDILLELLRRGGLLELTNPNDPARTRIRFKHQLLQEYFAASYLAQPANSNDELTQAVTNYDFDEVFLLLTDLHPNPDQIIWTVWQVDVVLACRCAGQTANLPDATYQKLIVELHKLLASDFAPNWNKGIQGLEELGDIRELIHIALSHSDNIVRSNAIYDLAELDAIEAIPEIMNLLDDHDSEVRSSAVTALRILGAKEAVPQIKMLLTDDDSEVLDSVVIALGELGVKEAVPQIKMLLTDDDEWLRSCAVWALEELGAKVEAISEMIVLLNDRNSYVRSNAVRALGDLRAKEAIPEIMKLLRGRSEQVLSNTVEALGKLEAKEAIPEIMKLLRSRSEQVLSNTIKALGELGAEEAISEIIKLLSANAAEVRSSAVKALTDLKVSEAVPEIIQMLYDPDVYVRSDAVEFLQKLEVKEVLLSRITDLLSDDIHVRRSMVWVIDHWGDASTVDKLGLLLDNPSEESVIQIHALREHLKKRLKLPKDR
jgi:HEAT repeat protein